MGTLKRPLGILLLALSPCFLHAQEARSFAMGGCGTALDWGPAALIWNPATLQFSATAHGCLTAIGASALDSTNIGEAALDYDSSLAAQSSAEPVRHVQSIRGLVGAQMLSYAIAVLFDQEMTHQASQGATDFLDSRGSGTLTPSPYDLSLSENYERLETFALGYSRSFPLGQVSAAIGSTFKLHQGSRFERTLLSGVFTQGVPNSVGYSRWTSDSGSGFSWDFGAMLKPTSNLQLGYVIENINSKYKWKAQRQVLVLDPATASETATSTVPETVESNRPRATRFGFTLVSPAKDSSLTTEMRRFQGTTRWRFGFERLWIPQHFVVRLGTFHEDTSDRRVVSGGVGYFRQRFDINLGLQADRWPVIQDSSAFGAAFSAAVRL